MVEEISPKEVFSEWKYRLKEENESRYLYQERREHIENLAEVFFNCGVSLDDAKYFRREVLNVLTTEKGRKGKGKHKGWKEKVLSDFDEVLDHRYSEINIMDYIGCVSEDFGSYEEKNEDIEEWSKRFGNNSLILTQAYIVGTSYHLEFMKHLYSRTLNDQFK